MDTSDNSDWSMVLIENTTHNNNDFSINTAILFLVFNRLDTTKEVFSSIQKARPARLYIAADGARLDKSGEKEKVEAVKNYVFNNIDWDCEVKTLFRETNLGCKVAVSSAIDWFFEHEEYGIILEDDCVPSDSFYRYCEELLELYKDDDRIAMISGDNFQFGKNKTEDSYYFSRYCHIWGWATWRRAWKHYDASARVWPLALEQSLLPSIFQSKSEQRYWSGVFQAIYEGKIDTWDYQWVLTAWSQGMVSIIPERNLIKNIGFGIDATHTHGDSIYAEMPAEDMVFPLRHPQTYILNYNADTFTSSTMFTNSLLKRGINKIRAKLKVL